MVLQPAPAERYVLCVLRCPVCCVCCVLCAVSRAYAHHAYAPARTPTTDVHGTLGPCLLSPLPPPPLQRPRARHSPLPFFPGPPGLPPTPSPTPQARPAPHSSRRSSRCVDRAGVGLDGAGRGLGGGEGEGVELRLKGVRLEDSQTVRTTPTRRLHRSASSCGGYWSWRWRAAPGARASRCPR